MAKGVIRYWAAAKDAAGTAQEPYQADTLDQALTAALARHAARPSFADVLRRCSFLVSGEQVAGWAREDVLLTDGGTIDVLPPFAGG